MEELKMNTGSRSTIEVGGLEVTFQRTVRVPAGKRNSLPAGLGSFPMYRVSDYKSGCPDNWRPDGFFFPIYRQEAMWINFGRTTGNEPRALIVGAGNINAISGKPFDPSKNKLEGTAREDGALGQVSSLDVRLDDKQNYIAVPPQRWIDGWKGPDGKVYQFVAAEMGSGETVEAQITGEETVGGIQLIVYTPKAGQHLIPVSRPRPFIESSGFEGYLNLGSLGYGGFHDGGAMRSLGGSVMRGGDSFSLGLKSFSASPARSMGLGMGGEIDQKIYPDPYGLTVWNDAPEAVDLVYMVSSQDFQQITGQAAPPTPVTYARCQELGLPWFEVHDEKLGDAHGSKVFVDLKPVGEGKGPVLDKLKPYDPHPVKKGE
jgi:hypothetical protein